MNGEARAQPLTASARSGGVGERLARLHRLEYPILVKEKDRRFYFIIPELATVGVGESVEEAYRDLQLRKALLFERVVACDAEDELALPGRPVTRRPGSDLWVFTGKIALASLLAGLILLVTGVLVGKNIAGLINNRLASISGTAMAKRAARDLVLDAEAAAKDPEARERVREFVRTLRPIAEEVWGLWPRDGRPPDAPGGPR